MNRIEWLSRLAHERALDAAETKRQRRHGWLERYPREKDDLVWGPDSDEDDPYGEHDNEYEELE